MLELLLNTAVTSGGPQDGICLTSPQNEQAVSDGL